MTATRRPDASSNIGIVSTGSANALAADAATPTTITEETWVAVTTPPSTRASVAVPLLPTRYAATSVLSWPGVSAWSAPSTAAATSNPTMASGDRDAERNRAARPFVALALTTVEDAAVGPAPTFPAPTFPARPAASTDIVKEIDASSALRRGTVRPMPGVVRFTTR